MDALMWSCLIEIRDRGMQDTVQLLLTEDQHVGKRTLVAHSPGNVHRWHWTQPSTMLSPSLAEGMFTVTHPFHPLYGQQFEVLTCRHNWGEYRVTFYETPDYVRALPAAWTSLVPPDPCVVLAAGRAVFLVTDLLALTQLILSLPSRVLLHRLLGGIPGGHP
jgi:Family of unknown function (DUF5372)